MDKPIVAVVGRPNVGKSTFFNAIVGKRISIVEDTPGVTRDRIYAEAEWNGVHFGMIDTGGIEPSGNGTILSGMREQAQIAMDMANVILFIVDGREGMTATDEEVAAILRKTGKKVLLIVNKVDNPRKPADNIYDFYSLGLGEPIPVSATNKLNFGDVLDEICDGFAPGKMQEEDEKIRIAVIGKPNVGKSSLINSLIRENRMIVSDMAGTTRDSVDTPVKWHGNDYVLVDTAGIRRHSKVSENIEKYSVVRAIAAIERADVCILMIDAADGLTEQDKKICGIAHEAGKGILIAVNKWDLIDKDNTTMGEFTKKIKSELLFASYAPLVFISVKDKIRLNDVMGIATKIANIRAVRIPTGKLNSLIADAMMIKQPPSDKGKKLKIYYAAQIGVKPPLFSFQVNSRQLMHFSYSRYIENRIRETFGFEGTSIKFVFREKREKEQ